MQMINMKVFKRKANADFRQAILGRMSAPAIHRTPGAQHAGAATVTRSPSSVIQQQHSSIAPQILSACAG